MLNMATTSHKIIDDEPNVHDMMMVQHEKNKLNQAVEITMAYCLRSM